MRKNTKILTAKRRFYLGAFIFLTVTAVALTLWSIDSRKTALLDIIVAPSSAQIEIGGHIFKSGTHRIKPGAYRVKITKDNFTPYSATLTVNDGATTNLHIYLLPTDGSYQWYLDHPEDGMILNTIGGRIADDASQQHQKSDPIFAITPFVDPSNNYQINTQKQEGHISIHIFLNTCSNSSADLYRAQAHNWLKGQGINLENYAVTHSSLCNP